MQHKVCFQAATLVAVLVLFLSASQISQAQKPNQDNWSRFRGPDATGVVADHPSLPEVWAREKNVAWVADIPGLGWSSPIVWGNKVFLTWVYSDEEQEKPKEGFLGEIKPKGVHHWMVYALDVETGEVLWSAEAYQGEAEPRSARCRTNSYASATPVTDGQRLYVLFGEHGLYCYDLNGNPLWTYPLESKKTFFAYGHAASPVTHDGRVIFTHDTHEESFIASLDGRTGELMWKIPRKENTTWATPLIWQNSLRTEIVTSGKNRIRSYDPDGNLLWIMDGELTDQLAISPFANNDLVYIASGYYKYGHRPVYAIKAGASGDISLQSWVEEGADSIEGRNAPRGGTRSEVAKMGGEITLDSLDEKQRKNDYVQWYLPRGSSELTTPIVYGDYFYTLHDKGFLTCHNANSGEEVYGKQRLPGYGRFMSSPWAYNNRLFCLSEDGETLVIKPGHEFEVLHINPLDEVCLATPAIAQGRLFIRTASKVYCITGGEE